MASRLLKIAILDSNLVDITYVSFEKIMSDKKAWGDVPLGKRPP